MKLSIVVPCYNESKNIPLILSRFDKILRNTQANIELILVNNGSTDDSLKVMEKELPNYYFVHIVRVEVNHGYGFGILSGLKEASGDFLGWTHADLQTDPDDIFKAFDCIMKSAFPDKTFIKGKRINRNFLDVIFTFGMTIFSSLALRTWLSDINAQPKLFARSLYKLMKNPPNDFSLDLYVYYLAMNNNYMLKTIPVSYKKRLFGEAKGGGSLKTKWSLIKRTFKYILKLRKELLLRNSI